MGYGVVWAGKRACNGVALLARKAEPVLILEALPGDRDDKASRYIKAVVDGVRFACKLAWFDRLIAHVRTLKKSSAPVVLLGDFNVVPPDADIYQMTAYDEDARLQPESRAACRKLLKHVWTDPVRELNPHKRVYPFCDCFRHRWECNTGLRIDHLLLSPPVAPRLASAGVDLWVRRGPKPSDHAPLWVKLAPEGMVKASKSGTKAKARKRTPTRK